MTLSLRLGLLLTLALLTGCPSSGGDDDDGTPTPCVPETDAQFCSRLSKTCEAVTDSDNCGIPRTAECGTCSGADACVANVCQAPSCANLSFATGSVIADVSTGGDQDAIAATTPDGGTILYQHRAACFGDFSVLIADRSGLTYQVTDISAVAGLAPMALVSEATLGLSPDGLTIVGTNVARTAILSSTRSALNLADFSAAAGGEFAPIVAIGTQQLSSPTLSADGLAFYFVLSGDPDANVNGIYESVRASTGDQFTFGSRMPAPVQDYGYVSGTSSDRMSLFVEVGFVTSVLTRTSLLQPFVNPNAPAAAPTIPGFRIRPLGDCSALIGTCTVGGCPSEEICTFPVIPSFGARWRTQHLPTDRAPKTPACPAPSRLGVSRRGV